MFVRLAVVTEIGAMVLALTLEPLAEELVGDEDVFTVEDVLAVKEVVVEFVMAPALT